MSEIMIPVKFDDGQHKGPAHSRGIIGAMFANRLIDAGWHYRTTTEIPSVDLWYRPEDPDNPLHFEDAIRLQFGEY